MATTFERRPHTGAYPHEPCCPKCREVKVCNICGQTWGYSTLSLTYSGGHCTNGHCTSCHDAVCSPSGRQQSAGHGHGSPERRMKRHQFTLNRKEA